MKTLLLTMLALTGCASEPVQISIPAPSPLSVIFYEYCGQPKMAVINLTDGAMEVIGQDNLDPVLIKQLEKLPHTTVYIASAEACGCFT